MKLSDRSHIRKRIQSFKQSQAIAKARGMDLLPSVDGPYLVRGDQFIGRKGSPEYIAALKPFDLAVQSPSHRNIAYLSVIADKIEDRHSTSIKAATEADLIAKLSTDYGLHPCPVKDTIFRTAAECQRIRLEHKGPTDKTDYARSIGYTGTKPVTVVDGKVISHGSIGWFAFCDRLHDKKQPA